MRIVYVWPRLRKLLRRERRAPLPAWVRAGDRLARAQAWEARGLF